MADPTPALTLDPQFLPALTTTVGVELTAVALQADGRLIVAGTFDWFHGHPCSGLARLGSSGLVDSTFALWPGVQGSVRAVAIQPDGKIVFGGEFTRVAGVSRWGLARLNPDGSLDQTFAPRLEGVRSAVVRVVRVLPDGRLLIGGDFRTVDQKPRSGVACIEASGELDMMFNPDAGVEDAFGSVEDLALLPEGGVVVAGLFTKFAGSRCPGLVRLDAHGAVDPSFAPAVDWSQGLVGVSRVRRQADGRFLIAGRFDQVEGEFRAGLARLRETGAADEGFDAGVAWSSLGDAAVHDLIVESDGRILVTGDFEQIGSLPRRGIVRLLANGAVDESFDPGSGLQALDGLAGVGTAVALQPDGSIVVVGAFELIDGEARHRLARLRSGGSVDRAFSAPERLIERGGTVNAILVQPNASILVGGDFERVGGHVCHALARLRPFGTLDETFDAGIEPGGVVNALALTPQGNVIVGGRFGSVDDQPRANLVRLLPNGQLDLTFGSGSGPNGEIYCVALQPDNQVVIGGRFDVVDGLALERLARLDAWGNADATFDPILSATIDVPDVYALAVQPDGKVLVGGYFDAIDDEVRSGLARLCSDGSVDSTFGEGTVIGGDLPLVTAIALDTAGRIVITGAFSAVTDEPRRGIARLVPEGGLDTTFDPGTAISGGEFPVVYGVAMGAAGGPVIVGEFDAFNETPRRNVARLDSGGHLDDTLDPAGFTDWLALAAAIEPSGGILVGGSFTTIAGQPRQGLARFRAPSAGPPSLWISFETRSVAVVWEGAGRLQSSDSPVGPWRDEPDLRSPAFLPPDQAARYFRVFRHP